MAAAKIHVPRKFDNIHDVKIREAVANLSVLPEQYVFPPEVLGCMDGQSTLSLPMIDLAGLFASDSGIPEVTAEAQTKRKEIVRQIGEASREWGFFQIVNHGFPEETFQEMEKQAREFFKLPVELKERAEGGSNSYGYKGRMESANMKALWVEYLAQWYYPTPEIVEELAAKIWPSGNSSFCNTVHEFCTSGRKLYLLLMELLAEALGLRSDTLSKILNGNPSTLKSAWRLHHYPVCPDPTRSLGLHSHSDSGLLTILKQDAVGGLQVLKGGKFVNATPIPGALVINIGDTLEAWSNGIFPSVAHRVVGNSKSNRLSMVLPFFAGDDVVIECPDELINESHPSIFRPFTGKEHRSNINAIYSNKENAIYMKRSRSIQFALRT